MGCCESKGAGYDDGILSNRTQLKRKPMALEPILTEESDEVVKMAIDDDDQKKRNQDTVEQYSEQSLDSDDLMNHDSDSSGEQFAHLEDPSTQENTGFFVVHEDEDESLISTLQSPSPNKYEKINLPSELLVVSPIACKPIREELEEELRENDEDNEIQAEWQPTADETIEIQQAQIETKDAFIAATKGKEYTGVKGDRLDEAVAGCLKKRGGLKIPMIRLTPGTYLLGSKKRMLEIKKMSVLVRVGGGWQSLTKFLNNNENSELINLSKEMKKSNEPLTKVVEDLLDRNHANSGVLESFHNYFGVEKTSRSSLHKRKKSISGEQIKLNRLKKLEKVESKYMQASDTGSNRGSFQSKLNATPRFSSDYRRQSMSNLSLTLNPNSLSKHKSLIPKPSSVENSPVRQSFGFKQ